MLKQPLRLRGISMIEVLVTIVITSVGLLGLNALQLKASRSTLDSGNKSQAVWILEDLTNRMRANVVGLDGYQTAGEVSCDSLAAPAVCSSYHTGSNKVLAAANCSAEQQAKSDIYEVLCGLGASVSNSEVVFGSPADFIVNPSLSIDIKPDKTAEITLSWDTRTSGQDASGNAVYALEDNGSSEVTLRTAISTRVYP